MHLLSNCLPGIHHSLDVVHGLDRMSELKTALESAGGIFHVFFTGISRSLLILLGSLLILLGSSSR